MNKSFFKMAVLALIIVANLSSCSKNEDDTNSTDDNAIINIPDSNFKAALVANTEINSNGNSEIESDEAANFEGTIIASGLEIKSAEGIEKFVNVTRINLLSNELTTIDVSKNTKVTQLLLEDNQLVSIDVSELSVLTDFKIHSNSLLTANLANDNNENMTRMEIQGNPDLNCIQVDAIPAPTAGWNHNSGSFSTNCSQNVL